MFASILVTSSAPRAVLHQAVTSSLVSLSTAINFEGSIDSVEIDTVPIELEMYSTFETVLIQFPKHQISCSSLRFCNSKCI